METSLCAQPHKTHALVICSQGIVSWQSTTTSPSVRVSHTVAFHVAHARTKMVYDYHFIHVMDARHCFISQMSNTRTSPQPLCIHHGPPHPFPQIVAQYVTSQILITSALHVQPTCSNTCCNLYHN